MMPAKVALAFFVFLGHARRPGVFAFCGPLQTVLRADIAFQIALRATLL
jgi:hypothetical protein